MASTENDFDFLFGTWTVRHRRLAKRLVGSDVWEEFTGTSTTTPVMGGFGNIEDNVLEFPGGSYRAIALRSFNAASGLWAIWWLDGRAAHHLDVPVIGKFENGVGTFIADDTFEGKAIKVRFLWSQESTGKCLWQQAFSADDGATWETNWLMNFDGA